ncbi:stage VI sporulation protein D [Bacillus manliponensis]|uniref:Stage VI sporulation protein D n=1 Tax=Bacillus manliponensis TaxID=574376 RepID=A0A073K670_9BACI|nr:stage VI sporulation protein D [Bacillus manliponensis]
MATDQQTSLRFSLKESVWFQKGQEVKELISISLDPDVVIEENEHEVIVRGQLDLTGEYVAEEDDSTFSLRELSPARMIDYVEVREDGVNELVHSFPLEISIPRSRVEDVERLQVEIEEFDYELPEVGCLQLLADISIEGLCAEEERESHIGQLYEEEEVLEEEEETEWNDYAFEPFQIESRKEAVIEEEEKEEETVHEEAAPQFELFGRKDTVAEKYGKQELEEKEEISYSDRDENALYLTKLFTKGGEEEFTKLRMYFVQEGDTVDSVAERYETSVQNLHRVNGMDDMYLSTGQIIYIPVPRTRMK